MTEQEVLRDESLIKRFTRDYKIPINIYSPEIFLERFEVLSKFRPELKKAYRDFIDMMGKLTSTQEFFEKYNTVKESMLDFIKSSEGYKRFNEKEDMSSFQVVKSIRDLQLPSKDIFKESNAGELFVSFDMIKGNFNSLKCYDGGIFNNKDTWEDFVVSFSSTSLCDYMSNSKYLREVILGNCNPKRHITYEKYLVSLILEDLLNTDFYANPHITQYIVFFSNDEVVFKLPHITLACDVGPFFLNNKYGIPFRMEIFKLHKIGDIGYVKEDLEDNPKYSEYPFSKFEFKCVNNFCMPFVLRKMLGENVTDNDKLFIHPNEGLLSKFIECPDVVIGEDLQESIEEAKMVERENNK